MKTAGRLLKKKKKGKRKYTWDTNVHTLVGQNMLQLFAVVYKMESSARTFEMLCIQQSNKKHKSNATILVFLTDQWRASFIFVPLLSFLSNTVRYFVILFFYFHFTIYFNLFILIIFFYFIYLFIFNRNKAHKRFKCSAATSQVLAISAWRTFHDCSWWLFWFQEKKSHFIYIFSA